MWGESVIGGVDVIHLGADGEGLDWQFVSQLGIQFKWDWDAEPGTMGRLGL